MAQSHCSALIDQVMGGKVTCDQFGSGSGCLRFNPYIDAPNRNRNRSPNPNRNPNRNPDRNPNPK